jgi:uncharacterized membrane protein
MTDDARGVPQTDWRAFVAVTATLVLVFFLAAVGQALLPLPVHKLVTFSCVIIGVTGVYVSLVPAGVLFWTIGFGGMFGPGGLAYAGFL